VNIRARGVQLVVMGACESGVRDRAERWSGVATRLVANRIPAVIAMQYLVNDGMAIAFSKALYRSLAAGWSLEEGVGAGRLAMYNHATGGYGATKRKDIWPDWGVPVLYAQPDAAVSLASIAAGDARVQLEEELVQTARIRTTEVKRGGRVVGASGASGIIDVKIKTGAVAGRVVGSEDFEGTKADVDIDAGAIEEGGEIVGIQDSGSRSRRSRR
jgi:CHAT domain